MHAFLYVTVHIQTMIYKAYFNYWYTLELKWKLSAITFYFNLYRVTFALFFDYYYYYYFFGVSFVFDKFHFGICIPLAFSIFFVCVCVVCLRLHSVCVGFFSQTSCELVYTCVTLPMHHSH